MPDDMLERAEGLLRRYNMSGASSTLDKDVITWLYDLNSSRGITSNFGAEYMSRLNPMHKSGYEVDLPESADEL